MGPSRRRGRFLAGSGPAFVTTGDFDRDGTSDLAIANTASGSVSVLLGDGDGNFQAPRTFAAGAAVWAVAIGDFNGDGAPDLATADNGANTVSVLPGNGDGTFQPKQSVGRERRSVLRGGRGHQSRRPA